MVAKDSERQKNISVVTMNEGRQIFLGLPHSKSRS